MSAPYPPSVSAVVPTLIGSDIQRLRSLLAFLGQLGIHESLARDAVARLAAIRDEAGDPVFTDHSETSPHVVLAEQLAWLATVSNFYAANAPHFMEDWMLALTGEEPGGALPEFAWVVYELSTPLAFDYTIPAGREVAAANGAAYESVLPLTIPAGKTGLETDSTGAFLHQQIYRAKEPGVAGRRAPAGTITTATSSIANVARLFNPVSSFGGRDAETWEQFRVRAFSTPLDKQLVVPEDYRQAVADYLGPGSKAIVLARADRPNTIQIAAIMPNGEPVTPANTGLVKFLNDRSAHSVVGIVAPVTTTVELDLEVVAEANSTRTDDEIREAVEADVAALTSPTGWSDWGEAENQFSPTRLAGQLRARQPDLDRVRVTRMKWTDARGVVVASAVNPAFPDREVVDTVPLKAEIGLPDVTLLVAVTRERAVNA